MDEGRKRVLGIMAAILASLHMQTADDLFGGPARQSPERQVDSGFSSDHCYSPVDFQSRRPSWLDTEGVALCRFCDDDTRRKISAVQLATWASLKSEVTTT
jgi:hypothetical protein